MVKKALAIYGHPGAGKGTQANLLAWKFGWIHFDTGRYLEQLFRDPESMKDPVIAREKELFDAGILCTPSFVLEFVTHKMREISRAGFSIVFSGSPRTLYEAFGTDPEYPQTQGLVEALVKEYGKEHLHFVELVVPEGTSVTRNSARKVCSVCGAMFLGHMEIEQCAFCMGPLRTRSLDKPEVITVRLEEYRNRTEPILNGLRERGFVVEQVNGEREPYTVFEDVKKILSL